jgi:hypothetical protein
LIELRILRRLEEGGRCGSVPEPIIDQWGLGAQCRGSGVMPAARTFVPSIDVPTP